LAKFYGIYSFCERWISFTSGIAVNGDVNDWSPLSYEWRILIGLKLLLLHGIVQNVCFMVEHRIVTPVKVHVLEIYVTFESIYVTRMTQ